jgi:hypothetical protein
MPKRDAQRIAMPFLRSSTIGLALEAVLILLIVIAILRDSSKVDSSLAAQHAMDNGLTNRHFESGSDLGRLVKVCQALWFGPDTF